MGQPKYNHYDVIMAILDVIGKDLDRLRDERPSKVTNVIQRLQGTFIATQENSVAGDNFTNITNSVIATRGSIARAVIAMRERQANDGADAIENLQKYLCSVNVPEEKRSEALDLLRELAGHACGERPSKPVLKSLGSGLWDALKNAGAISEAVTKIWPSVESLWR